MWGAENWGEMIWGGVQGVPLMGPFGFLAMAICFLVGGWIVQSKRRSHSLIYLAGSALLVVPLAAMAALILPHTFTNGTVADADEVNQNFSAVESAVNVNSGLIDSLSVSATCVERVGPASAPADDATSVAVCTPTEILTSCNCFSNTGSCDGAYTQNNGSECRAQNGVFGHSVTARVSCCVFDL